MTTAAELLAKLDDLRAHLEVIQLIKQDAINSVLTPEIKAELDAIDAEFDAQTEAVEETIAEVEAAVKAAVLEGGETVKTERLQAIWVKPRVRWDAVALDAYALDKPELYAFRREGKPSVSIRRRK